MIAPMLHRDDYLAMDDPNLLTHCEVHLYKASGPGGQHRNKVSSAVRLHLRATGLSATAAESRSQHENKRRALRRLRAKLACRLRRAIPPDAPGPPAVVAECILPARGAPAGAPGRIQAGRRDPRFWRVAAFLLDVLDGADGRVGPAARRLGVTTGSLTALWRSDRLLLAAVQELRKRHGHHPLR